MKVCGVIFAAIIVKVLPFCLLLAVLLPTTQSTEPTSQSHEPNTPKKSKIIPAVSAEELWEHGTPKFWTAMTKRLSSSTLSDYIKALNSKSLDAINLIERVNQMKPTDNFDFSKDDPVIVWEMFHAFVELLQEPTMSVELAKKLKTINPDPTTVNDALNKSLNTLSIPKRRYIQDLLTFVNKFPGMETIFSYNEHFLYVWLTKDIQTRYKLAYLFDQIVIVRQVLAKLIIGTIIPGPYDIYDSMSTKFEKIIYYDQQKEIFYKEIIYGNYDVASCWKQKKMNKFFPAIVKFIEESCVTTPGIFKENKDSSEKIIKEKLMEKIDEGWIDFAELDDPVTITVLFKRFFEKLTKPVFLRDIPQLWDIKKEDVQSKIQDILKLLSELSREIAELLNEVLLIARKVHDNRNENGYEKEGSVSSMIYTLMRKQSPIDRNYPMLNYIIEKYYDGQSVNIPIGSVIFNTTKSAFMITDLEHNNLIDLREHD